MPDTHVRLCVVRTKGLLHRLRGTRGTVAAWRNHRPSSRAGRDRRRAQCRALPRAELSGGKFREAAELAVETLRSRGFDPSIIVVNSWRAAVELGRGRFAADPEETERFQGAPLDIEYLDGPPMCLVADVPRLLNIRRWRVQPERPFDRVLVNGLLLVGVEEMTAERATAIVEENEEFRRMGDGTLAPLRTPLRSSGARPT